MVPVGAVRVIVEDPPVSPPVGEVVNTYVQLAPVAPPCSWDIPTATRLGVPDVELNDLVEERETGVVSELVQTLIPDSAVPAGGFVTGWMTSSTESPALMVLLTLQVRVAPLFERLAFPPLRFAPVVTSTT